MRGLAAVCLIVVLATACAGESPSVTRGFLSSEMTCEVHDVTVAPVREAIEDSAHAGLYGVTARDEWSEWREAYMDASDRIFPLARRWSSLSGGKVRVWSCPECVAAKAAWLEEHPEPE